MVSVKKITKEVEQAKADTRQKKEQLKRRIITAEESVAAAKNEMDVAAAADDEQAFIAASDKVRFNESVIKANEARLAELENVSKETALSTINKVRAAQAEIARAAEEKAAGSIYDIYVLAIKAQEDIATLQALLSEYAQETGSDVYVKPYPYTGELDKMLQVIKANKNRAEQFKVSTELYKIIS